MVFANSDIPCNMSLILASVTLVKVSVTLFNFISAD